MIRKMPKNQLKAFDVPPEQKHKCPDCRARVYDHKLNAHLARKHGVIIQ